MFIPFGIMLHSPNSSKWKKKKKLLKVFLGFPGDSDGQESASNVGNLVLIPGFGRSSRGGHGNPLQYSCLENPMDKGDWQATVYGIKELDTTEAT